MEKERSLRDAILAELGDESKRRDEVIEGVGETRDVISHALKRMLRDGEVIQPSHGSYAKPQHGAAYTPTDEAIIKAMLTLPGHRATIPELMAVTCRDRIPIMDNAKRMVGKGLLKRLTSGHGVVARFELAPNVLRQ